MPGLPISPMTISTTSARPPGPAAERQLRRIVTHRSSSFGLDSEHYYGDGVVTGYGRIDGRLLGEATRQLVQALPIDVRTIGNHDFAYGEVAVLEHELSRAFTAKERTALIDLLQRATDVLVAQTGASAAR